MQKIKIRCISHPIQILTQNGLKKRANTIKLLDENMYKFVCSRIRQ